MWIKVKTSNGNFQGLFWYVRKSNKWSFYQYKKLHIPTKYFPPLSRDNFLEAFCIIVHPSLTLACWSFWSLFHIKFLFVWKSGQKRWKSRKVFEGRLFLYRFVFSHILSILSTTPQHFSRIYTALHFCYLRLSMAIFQLSAHQASFTHWNVSVPNHFTLKSGIHQCFLTWIFFCNPWINWERPQAMCMNKWWRPDGLWKLKHTFLNRILLLQSLQLLIIVISFLVLI